MSLRDAAACLGVSKSELLRWQQMAALDEAVFESRLAGRLADLVAGRLKHVSASMMLNDPAAPVPARGRVQRAVALFNAMTPGERAQFYRAMRADAKIDRAAP